MITTNRCDIEELAALRRKIASLEIDKEILKVWNDNLRKEVFNAFMTGFFVGIMLSFVLWEIIFK